MFFLALLGCERDKVEPILQQKEETGLSLSKITLDELPSLILNKTNQAAQRSAHRFGPPRTDLPIYVSTNHKGYKSYTIALAKSLQAPNTSALYFDNRVVHLYQDGTRKAYVIRYEPTKKWYDSSRDFKNYSGKITFYSTNGKKVNSILLHEGHIQRKTKSKVAAKEEAPELECMYVVDEIVTICTDGGHLEGEENSQPMECTETYYVDLQCRYDLGNDTGGGTNILDFPSENENNSDEGKPDGESEGESDGSGFTPPIIEPLEIIDVSELDNPCVEGIIEKLQTKDSYDLLTPDINEADHLSKMILDLFDHSSKYTLHFKIQQLGVNNKGYEINGETSLDEENKSKWHIKLDTDLVDEATQLFLAKTIIHESTHVYIGYILKEQVTSDMFKDLQSLYAKFTQKNTSPVANNLTQHEFIGQYVEALAYSLAAYDNHRHSMTYYKKLSWGGLETSSAYKALPNKSAVQTAIHNERFNKKDAKSSPCN